MLTTGKISALDTASYGRLDEVPQMVLYWVYLHRSEINSFRTMTHFRTTMVLNSAEKMRMEYDT